MKAQLVSEDKMETVLDLSGFGTVRFGGLMGGAGGLIGGVVEHG